VNVEIRVRYLSFLGIGKDVTTCGVIVHTARDEFESHCFYSTPSTGAVCKAIEAACVLRYQKCLDAHHGHGGANNAGPTGSRSGSNDTGSHISSSSIVKAGLTTPKAAAANLAIAFRNVLASFGKATSEEK